MCEEDRRLNDEALIDGSHLLSATASLNTIVRMNEEAQRRANAIREYEERERQANERKAVVTVVADQQTICRTSFHPLKQASHKTDHESTHGADRYAASENQ